MWYLYKQAEIYFYLFDLNSHLKTLASTNVIEWQPCQQFFHARASNGMLMLLCTRASLPQNFWLANPYSVKRWKIYPDLLTRFSLASFSMAFSLLRSLICSSSSIRRLASGGLRFSWDCSDTTRDCSCFNWLLVSSNWRSRASWLPFMCVKFCETIRIFLLPTSNFLVSHSSNFTAKNKIACLWKLQKFHDDM